MDKKHIKVLHIEFNNITIDWQNFILTFDFRIGSKPFLEKIALNNCFYLETLRSNGVITQKRILDVDYAIFITSKELNVELQRKGFIAKTNEVTNPNETIILKLRSWLVEIQKSFQEYKICFIRQIDVSQEIQDTRAYINGDKIFRGFYFSESEKSSAVKRFMMLDVPKGKSKLVELFKHKLKFGNKDFDILIGKFILNSCYCFAYIFQIENLEELCSEDIIKSSPFFIYENNELPIPQLPITKVIEFNVTKSDLYTSYIKRSLILSIFISSKLTMELINEENQEYNVNTNEFIEIYDERTEERALSIYRKADKSYIPSKIFIYPFNDDDLVPEFLPPIPDFYEESTREPDDQIEISEADEVANALEETDKYPSCWDSLDTREIYEDNYELAEFEYELEDKDVDYENTKWTDSQFFTRSEYLKLLLSDSIYICIDKKFIIIELKKDGLYKHKYCPIIQSPFVEGLSVYSGILSIEDLGDLPFCIVERCPKDKLKEIISKFMSYKEPYTIQRNNCYVCFDRKKYECLIF